MRLVYFAILRLAATFAAAPADRAKDDRYEASSVLIIIIIIKRSYQAHHYLAYQSLFWSIQLQREESAGRQNYCGEYVVMAPKAACRDYERGESIRGLFDCDHASLASVQVTLCFGGLCYMTTAQCNCTLNDSARLEAARRRATSTTRGHA